MPSIFSKIIAGDIPCYKIAEDDQFIAFLDIMPLRMGHVLVVPKLEMDKCFDLPQGILAAWFVFAQPIGKAIEHAFPCNRCGVAIIGLEVPHAHMHLVPISTAHDLDFTQPKLKLQADELTAVQQRIVAAMAG